jgi:Lar family restriction alleviation protein
MSEIELKPCPFCGHPPVHRQIQNDGRWLIDCNTVNCVRPTTGKRRREAEAIEAWNARPSSHRAGMLDWQPIETVPKKTYVLLVRWEPDTQWHGRMEVDRCNDARCFGTFNQWYPPTHWMPLPTPPIRAAAGDE